MPFPVLARHYNGKENAGWHNTISYKFPWITAKGANLWQFWQLMSTILILSPISHA